MIRRRRTRKERREQERARARRWLAVIGVLFVLVFVAPPVTLVGGAVAMIAQATADMPRPAETTFVSTARGITRLTDRTGNTVIYTVEDPLGNNRQWVRLADLPPYVAQATLLVEDPPFLQATRYDPARTFALLWENTLSGPIRADPTLTGRLVRNAIAPQPEQVSVDDRTREIALVAEINRRYTPEEVLEWHLNTNFYGNEAYGIDAAAQVYLGKRAAELTLDEAALLASIPTAPQFNPIDNETAARGRQSDTLRRLLVEGFITPEEHALASQTLTPVLSSTGQSPSVAPDFAFYARRQAEQILDNLGMDGGRMVSRGGLQITTTLDLDLYYQAECALRAHLERLAGRPGDTATLDGGACLSLATLSQPTRPLDVPPDTGVIVVLDAETGALLAMVGGGARVAHQPGMTLAPFIYFEGFRESRQGVQYTPASMMLDIPRRFPGSAEGLIYQPVNPDGRFRGPVSLREAAVEGLLPAAVQVANNHGLTNVIRSAHRMGLNSLDTGIYDLSLLDRGGLVSVLDMAYASSVLASMGSMYGVETRPRGVGFRNRNPVAVVRIADHDGRILWEYNPQASRVNVFSTFSELGYLVNDIFADSDARRQKFGANNPLTLANNRPAAVVNTVTSNRLDNWTIGYTPQRVIAVHLSRADTNPFSLEGYGLDGAARLWQALAEYAHRDLPPLDWVRPSAIVDRQVCQISGLLPNEVCPVRREIFIQGITPTRTDTYWQSVEINSQTGQRATFNTPAALRISETYFVPPAEALDWWVANNQRLPPEDFDILSRSDDDPFRATVIIRPEALAWLRGTIEIRGVVNERNFASYQLRYGEGAINPQNWFNIGERQTVIPADGLLGVWDTTGLDGIYTIELTVEATNGTRERAIVQVRVDNIPPTVVLSAGEPGKIYRWPAETIIPLEAQVTDNLAVARVEFYNRGRMIFSTDSAPYRYDFAIGGIGTETFNVVAYDAAGNRSTSNEISVEITR